MLQPQSTANWKTTRSGGEGGFPSKFFPYSKQVGLWDHHDVCACVLQLTFELIDFTKHGTNIMLLKPTHTSYFQNFLQSNNMANAGIMSRGKQENLKRAPLLWYRGNSHRHVSSRSNNSKHSSVEPLLGQRKKQTDACRLTRRQSTLSWPFPV